MAKKVKAVKVEAEAVAVSERPEVYDERADKKEAEQKAAFAAAAMRVQEPSGPLPDVLRDIENTREALKHPLGDGQAFFESPEGYIVVAQADRDRVWCQKANKGQGMFINPRR